MKNLTWICVLACLAAGLALAAEEGRNNTVPARGESSQGVTGVSVPRTPNRTATRDQVYQQRLSRQAELHQAEVSKLTAIKKIAEEENAARTVEAIQKLIDQKNAEYKESLASLSTQRAERTGQVRRQGAVTENAAKPETNTQQ